MTQTFVFWNTGVSSRFNGKLCAESHPFETETTATALLVLCWKKLSNLNKYHRWSPAIMSRPSVKSGSKQNTSVDN